MLRYWQQDDLHQSQMLSMTATSLPKILLWGRDPSAELKSRISRKKASWIEMEFHSAVYTWKSVFNYPIFLLRPLGVVLLLSVLILNIYPPPMLYGSCCCAFYNTLLGGAIFTWFRNYCSPSHSIPLFITLFCVMMVLCDSGSDTKPNSNTFTFTIMFLPTLIGYYCGPIFIKLGELER